MHTSSTAEDVEVFTLVKDAKAPLLASSIHSKETYPPINNQPNSTEDFGHSSFCFVLFTIVFPLILAVVLIACHHVYYAYLDGKPDRPYDTSNPYDLLHSQKGAQTLGNVFAFLIKACFTSAIGSSFVQLSWRFARRKACTISTWNAMWSSPTDPFAFLNVGYWKSAKVLVLIAIASWCMPLVALFPASSITIRGAMDENKVSCVVPAMDMDTQEGLYVGDIAGVYPLAPNFAVDRDIQVIKLSSRPSEPPRPAECVNLDFMMYETMKPGTADCFYKSGFSAPRLDCSFGDPDNQLPAALADLPTPDPQWLAVGYNPNTAALVNDTTSDVNTHLAVYYTSWEREDTSDAYSPILAKQNNITCSLFQAEYSIRHSFPGITGSVSMLDANPVTVGTFAQVVGSFASDGYTGGKISPNAALNSLALVSAFYKGLVGSILTHPGGFGSPYLFSDGLMLQYTRLWRGDGLQGPVPRILEVMFNSVIVSLSTTSYLGATETTCTMTGGLNVFDYKPMQLLSAYGSGLLAAIIAASFGLTALYRSGRGTQAGFASFVEATRFSQLQGVRKEDVIYYAALPKADYRMGFRQRGKEPRGDIAS